MTAMLYGIDIEIVVFHVNRESRYSICIKNIFYMLAANPKIIKAACCAIRSLRNLDYL